MNRLLFQCTRGDLFREKTLLDDWIFDPNILVLCLNKEQVLRKQWRRKLQKKIVWLYAENMLFLQNIRKFKVKLIKVSSLICLM